MASGYALPIAGGSHHAHSHSYSGVHLSPSRATPNTFAHSNGSPKKQVVSNSLLFTHHESSRETSPVSFPNGSASHFQQISPFKQNGHAFQENARLSNHRHSHSTPPMKSRPRGESDLGRPADSVNSVYRPTLESIPAASTSWFSIPEALTSMLTTLPYLFASASYSSTVGLPAQDFPPLSAYAPSTRGTLPDTERLAAQTFSRRYGFIDTCVLTSGTMLAVGIVAKMQFLDRASDRGKGTARPSLRLKTALSVSALRSMATRALSIGLPFFASMLIGGSRTGLILIVAMTANLTCADGSNGPLIAQWKQIWASKVATSVVILLSFIIDEIGLTIQASLTDLILGYLALAVSVLILPPPLPSATVTSPSKRRLTDASSTRASLSNGSGGLISSAASPLTGSPAETDVTLVAGLALAMFTVLASILLSTSPHLSVSSLILITLAVASMAAAIFFSEPSTLRSQSKAGLALGCFITAGCSFMFSPSLWPGTVCNGGLSALSFLGVLYDTDGSFSRHTDHDAHDHVHIHAHQHSASESSAFTKFVLAYFEPGSLVYSILSEKDSRRIAYFTALNFGFMLVQAAYGYLSGSLGLLSDTVHMFFDCIGLIVGLGAAVASRWPTSPEMPYGWGKLNTLAGFGNGIFLMLVSVEFVWEAIEGILEERRLRHVEELLVVSTLGLLVNLVGLFAFGHAHAGHDHGPAEGHAHSHSHSHKKGQDGTIPHMNGHAHSSECSHGHDNKANSSKAGHSQHNENMHGIFLHVAADAGGSLAVIISTALNLWRPNFLWDPLATILIAILIFAAAVPLVTSSGRKLLLVVPDELEYAIKNTLQELGELRGVVGHAVPRFWVDDKGDSAEVHGHDHHHHGHDHAAHGTKKVIGVVHVIAAASADLDDVTERVEAFVAERNMNIVIQVERETDGSCWCGGSGAQSG